MSVWQRRQRRHQNFKKELIMLLTPNKNYVITGSVLALALLYEPYKVKHRKMENLNPRQIQTIEVTVIKLCRIDDVDHMNKWFKFHWDYTRRYAPQLREI
jgi:hypothetical protein